MSTLNLDHAEPVPSLGGDSWSMRTEPLPLSSPEDQLGSPGYTMHRHCADGAVMPWLWVQPCVRAMCELA